MFPNSEVINWTLNGSTISTLVDPDNFNVLTYDQIVRLAGMVLMNDHVITYESFTTGITIFVEVGQMVPLREGMVVTCTAYLPTTAKIEVFQ